MYFVHGTPNLTSFVTDMLIYYVLIGYKGNAKQCQTYNLPGDEVKGAVPQLSWITLRGL